MESQERGISPADTVAAVALRHPGVIPVFEQLGIDYCCGGGRSLQDAVAARQLDWESVKAQIQWALDASSGDDASSSWTDASLSELIAHILDRYHQKLREDLPLLSGMGGKVVNAHGDRHPETRETASVFAGLQAELESHMMKEEHVLFPFIEQLETGTGHRHPMIGHIASPIGVMRHEHDSAGTALARLRELTSGYQTPADGCTTFHAYYDGLARVERDLHEHIHLENNVLFPRAEALEAQVLRSR